MKFKWKCPECGATAHKCGKKAMADFRHVTETCDGFICDCEGEGESKRDHGTTFANPCTEARCYHCGWAGTFPGFLQRTFLQRASSTTSVSKKLQAWEKKALEAGWKPPGRRPKKEKRRCDFDCERCRGGEV